MSATVSEITSDDRSALAGLLSRIAQFKPAEVDVALELIDATLLDPGGSGYECLVARDDQRVVGYICAGPTPMTLATWDLYWIAVDPNSQGRGIGQALYRAFVPRMKSRDARHVRIETSSQEIYAATSGFYQKLGFTIAGRLRDFYAPDDDLLIFYCTLD